MYLFDRRVASYLVSNLNKGAYATKIGNILESIIKMGQKLKTKNIELIVSTNWKQMHYLRHADNFVRLRVHMHVRPLCKILSLKGTIIQEGDVIIQLL